LIGKGLSQTIHAKIDSCYYFKNTDIKFLWGDLKASPTTFLAVGNCPHHPHGVDAYDLYPLDL